MKRLLGITVTALTLLSPFAASAQEVLSAVHAFPANFVYTQSFLEFVDKVNERGAGVISIDVRGGPEAIGMFEQPAAVQDGIVDMVYTAGSFYGGTVAEKDALVATTITAVEARANGGIDLYNQIHQEKMGVYFLGWMDSGVSFNMWFVNEPALDGTGRLDISSFKLRGNPIYNAFFTEYLGASIVNLPSTELYTALERGTVDATAWTSIGIMNPGWDEFLNYRLEPDFFSTDLGVIVNLDAWNALSEESRQILQEVAIEHEASSVAALSQLRDEEFAELESRGMQVIALEGEAAAEFLAEARNRTLERMSTQMEEQGGTENYDRMIELFITAP